jgi:Predicted membrane protein (DUF2207)
LSIVDYVIWTLIVILVVFDLCVIVLFIGVAIFSRFTRLVKALVSLGLAAVFVGYCFLLPPRAGGAPRLPAPGGGERVEQFDVAMRVRADGVLDVRETIDYDFGAHPHRVFYRLLATNGGLKGKGNGLHSVRARSMVPALTTVHTYRPNPTHGRQTLIAIRPPSGQPAWRGGGHRFVIEYELRHVTYDRGEVEVAPVASSWRLPIERFHATLTGDTRPTEVTCEVGLDTGRKCETIRRNSSGVELAQRAVHRTGIVVRGWFPGIRHTISEFDEASPFVYAFSAFVPLICLVFWRMAPDRSGPRRTDPRLRVSSSGSNLRRTAGSQEEYDSPELPDIPELENPWTELGGGDIGSGH